MLILYIYHMNKCTEF